MQTKTIRSELKFLIGYQEYHYLKSLLKSVMTSDPNSNENGEYYIRSLYFDDASNQDYHQREAGLKDRQKIRLRYYDCNDTLVKLELKQKSNHCQVKETLRIQKADAVSLSNGNIDVLLSYEDPIAQKLHGLLAASSYRPVMLVDYEREAYVHEAYDIRINFDRNIRAKGSFDLYDYEHLMTPLDESNLMVLEVKFTHVLPDYIRDILSSAKLAKTDYSKYCMARTAIW